MQTPLTHENGQASGTKLLFSLAALVVIFRLMVEGTPLLGVYWPPLDIGSAATLLGVLGGVYGGRRYTDARFAPPASSLNRTINTSEALLEP